MKQLNLFITGGAGTVKSLFLCLVKEYFQNSHEYPTVLVAAPTGVAAFNINGHTLHTLLQLPRQIKCKVQTNIPQKLQVVERYIQVCAVFDYR